METTDEVRATPTQMQRQHVFVVNGAPDFLDLMRVLLQDERYNVTTTNFVPHTFEQVVATAPSLLIVDLAVGEEAGWALLAELRRGAATAKIPVIVVSTTPRLLEQAKAEHAAGDEDCYLLKPFDLDELLGMVERLIGTA
jgi:two-component system sensor histidine kinase/response regulator